MALELELVTDARRARVTSGVMPSSSAPRQRWRPTRCKDCGAKEPPISLRGLCARCGVRRQVKSAVEQVAKEGRYYEAWRESMRNLSDSL